MNSHYELKFGKNSILKVKKNPSEFTDKGLFCSTKCCLCYYKYFGEGTDKKVTVGEGFPRKESKFRSEDWEGCTLKMCNEEEEEN